MEQNTFVFGEVRVRRVCLLVPVSWAQYGTAACGRHATRLTFKCGWTRVVEYQEQGPACVWAKDEALICHVALCRGFYLHLGFLVGERRLAHAQHQEEGGHHVA